MTDVLRLLNYRTTTRLSVRLTWKTNRPTRIMAHGVSWLGHLLTGHRTVSVISAVTTEAWHDCSGRASNNMLYGGH